MNGEKFIIQKEYFETASVLADVLMNYINQQRVVIAVAGESGSGKSITALCLKEEFAKRRILASILHQDDYFFLPPKTNHNARKNDLSLVGPMEVDLDKMQSHIDDFLEGSDSIQKPTVYIQENKITEEKMFFKNSQILIVEGTYSFLLNHLSCLIFMSRNYKETHENRKKRARDIEEDFIEEVLKIEHNIISPAWSKADIIIDKDYSVRIQDLSDGK